MVIRCDPRGCAFVAGGCRRAVTPFNQAAAVSNTGLLLLSVISFSVPTALMVLGPEEGLPLATEHGLEVCFQLRNEDGSYRELATEGYEPLVAERLNR
mgnify:CR=1 FL=1